MLVRTANVKHGQASGTYTVRGGVGTYSAVREVTYRAELWMRLSLPRDPVTTFSEPQVRYDWTLLAPT